MAAALTGKGPGLCLCWEREQLLLSVFKPNTVCHTFKFKYTVFPIKDRVAIVVFATVTLNHRGCRS